MKILILGGSGMLGHRLWLNLNKHHETWVTVRTNAGEFPDWPEFPKDQIIPGVNALVFDQVARALAVVKPEIVINCIGLIKQLELSNDPLSSIQVNALLPHQIALICRTAGIRMIHISTDCVFSGIKGSYVETDESDATDLYGRTKFLGELAYSHTITLRTSIIGRELKNHLGLIDWFLQQSGSIRGFTQAIYTGFTTDELSRIIINHVIPRQDLHGLFHVSSEAISKHDLLVLAKNAFDHQVDIQPYADFQCDRSLVSTHFRSATGYLPPSWEEMITELATTKSDYSVL